MIVQSLRNHIVASAIHVIYVFSPGSKSVLTTTFTRPSLTGISLHLAMGMVLRDVIFWIIHRLWHVPGVYEHIHKKHHEVVCPGDHHVWTISYMGSGGFCILYMFIHPGDMPYSMDNPEYHVP